MDFNLITNAESCHIVIPQLLYYSSIPTALAAILIGIFVYFKDRKALSNKILLGISTSFSLWVVVNLITWLEYDSRIIMFVWSFFGILSSLIFILSIYFVYTFIKKVDVSFKTKLFFLILLLPVIILSATKYNLPGFNDLDCGAVEAKYYLNYYYFLGLLSFFWILILSIVLYRKAEADAKKQIVFLAIGIEFFLALFFLTGIIASIMYASGVSYAFELEQYGLFGMTFFIGMLGYLIVKFKAFNIKLLGTQALIFAQFALIGAMFFFATSTTNIVLLAITLLGTAIMGWYLVRSVKLEVQRKEELQMMSDKLAAANDQLRKLDNAKSEFISIASHQLRTPLTAIKGFVSLLLEGTYGEINPQAVGALNKVYQANDHLVQLVEDLLNISRIESGRMQYEFRPWKLEPIITELRDNFVLMAKDNGLYLDVKLPTEPLPEIEMDGGKIREVISNLISNGLKYTKKGGVSLRIEREPDLVRITVSDTGIGVPADEIPYLFGKFSRGKDTTRLNATGTGLGLYVGREMIAAHHGKIWVESDGADRGSRFIIELPIKHVD